jgi:hypothetical protein
MEHEELVILLPATRRVDLLSRYVGARDIERHARCTKRPSVGLHRGQQLRGNVLTTHCPENEEVIEDEHSRQRYRGVAWVQLCESNRRASSDSNEDDGLAMVEPLSEECASRGEIACLALELAVLIKQNRKRLNISGHGLADSNGIHGGQSMTPLPLLPNV